MKVNIIKSLGQNYAIKCKLIFNFEIKSIKLIMDVILLLIA